MKIINCLFLLFILSTFVQAQNNYNLNLLGTRSYTQDLNDIWGWRAANGTEYALVGTVTGTSLVSLSNPASPNQVQFISGAQSIWRDLKTFGNYCYVTCDQGRDGLLIIDLSTLPNAVNYVKWRPRLTINGVSDTLNTAHNLWIDENGYCYIAGSNINDGEPFILNLNTNPWNPTLVGFVPPVYAHDVYARGDTLWTSDIYTGEFSAYNVTNKSNPVLLGQHVTPMTFTHNAWISDDGNTLFTTDERANAWIGSYDVSDMNNIKELDRWRPLETEGTGVIPHNVHVLNDFIVISHYTDGLIVLDGSRPDNLIEVGKYDTYPQVGTGFFGCWGAYPFFQSGKVVGSDINNGLFVFQPNYQRACWLEGNISDSISAAPLSNVRVTISSTPVYDDSRLNGDYKTGYGVAGTYNVTYSKAGYYPKTLSVSLQNGVLTIRDVELVPMVAFSFTGQVVDADNANAPIANAKVEIVSASYNYSATTNSSGNFTIPSMFSDTYSVYAGKWGYKTVLVNQGIAMNNPSPVIPLNKGYRDEFALDLGWAVSGNATTGAWERAVSEEILFNNQPATPDEDFVGDIGNQCYVTGANNGGSLSADDVDNGNTLLRSPIFDLSNYIDPYVSFQAYFINVQGSGTPNDSMIIRISNGTNTSVLRFYNTTVYGWRAENFKISDYITPTANMRFEVETADRSPGHVLEAAFDYFEVVDSAAATTAINTSITESDGIVVYPNPFDKNFSIDISSETLVDEPIQIFDLNGRLIHSQTIQRIGIHNIELKKELPAGFYMLKIGKSTLKLIKN
jgi:choice-of-anchor B domain-containing protein